MSKEMIKSENMIDEIRELRRQLEEANETIEAIRGGQVDALVVQNENGHQLYTLKSADQTYRVFIEKMKEGAVTLNEDGTILYSNSQFADMVELPLPKVIGLSFGRFIPEQYAAEFSKLIKKGWQSDSKGEICIKNRDGRLVPFLLSFTTLSLDEGNALSIILTDLTDQKENEKQLKQKNEQLEEATRKTAEMNERLEEMVKERTRELLASREHFKFLADNIPVIVWTANTDGRIDYFNRCWYDYAGESVEESIKKGLIEYLLPEDREFFISEWKKAMTGQDFFEIEIRIRRKSDNHYRYHSLYAVPFRDGSSKITMWIGTMTDIEDSKTELEKKDEFIGVASHELKTPLTSLKGYIQLMNDQSGQLPDKINQYVKKANDSINKLQHLIDDLLDVSRIQSGKLDFNISRVNISDLVRECVTDCSHMYVDRSIEGKITDGLFVNGNADRLEQVFMNFVSNAVKYSAPGTPVTVVAERIDGFVKISVADRGIGLSEDNKKKIFDRFFRVDGSKHLSSGLGMGLYISAEIIKAHKGKMEVESQPNDGATFSFLLPVA
jgi:two-component system CheB/CheR fusion protein